MTYIQKFIIFFATSGFFLAFASNLIARHTALPFILNLSLCSLCSAILGYGVYKVFETQVPEILTFLQNLSFTSKHTETTNTSPSIVPSLDKALNHHQELQTSTTVNETEEQKILQEESMPQDVNDVGALFASQTQLHEKNDITSELNLKKKNENYGRHIVVGNVKIQNEPQLMAEAIRSLIHKDEDKNLMAS